MNPRPNFHPSPPSILRALPPPLLLARYRERIARLPGRSVSAAIKRATRPAMKSRRDKSDFADSRIIERRKVTGEGWEKKLASQRGSRVIPAASHEFPRGGFRVFLLNFHAGRGASQIYERALPSEKRPPTFPRPRTLQGFIGRLVFLGFD